MDNNNYNDKKLIEVIKKMVANRKPVSEIGPVDNSDLSREIEHVYNTNKENALKKADDESPGVKKLRERMKQKHKASGVSKEDKIKEALSRQNNPGYGDTSGRKNNIGAREDLLRRQNADHHAKMRAAIDKQVTGKEPSKISDRPEPRTGMPSSIRSLQNKDWRREEPKELSVYDQFLNRFSDSKPVSDLVRKLKEEGHDEPYAGSNYNRTLYNSPESEETKYDHVVPVFGKIDPKGHLGKLVHQGGHDPFMWADSKFGVTKNLLKELSGKPLKISTRSDLVSHDDYMSEIDKDNHEIEIHVPAYAHGENAKPLEGAPRYLEPGMPSPKRRLNAAAKLRNAGYRVSLVLDTIKGGNKNASEFAYQGYLKENHPELAGIKTRFNEVELNDASKRNIANQLGEKQAREYFNIEPAPKNTEKKAAPKRRTKSDELFEMDAKIKEEKKAKTPKPKAKKEPLPENVVPLSRVKKSGDYLSIKNQKDAAAQAKSKLKLISNLIGSDGNEFASIYMSTHPDHEKMIGAHYKAEPGEYIGPDENKWSHAFFDHVESATNQGFDRVIVHAPKQEGAIDKKGHLSVMKSKSKATDLLKSKLAKNTPAGPNLNAGKVAKFNAFGRSPEVPPTPAPPPPTPPPASPAPTGGIGLNAEKVSAFKLGKSDLEKDDKAHKPNSPEDTAHDIDEGSISMKEGKNRLNSEGVKKMLEHLRAKTGSNWERSEENKEAGDLNKARVDNGLSVKEKVAAREQRNDRQEKVALTPTGRQLGTNKTYQKRIAELRAGADRRRGEKIVGTPKDPAKELTGVHHRSGDYMDRNLPITNAAPVETRGQDSKTYRTPHPHGPKAAHDQVMRYHKKPELNKASPLGGIAKAGAKSLMSIAGKAIAAAKERKMFKSDANDYIAEEKRRLRAEKENYNDKVDKKIDVLKHESQKQEKTPDLERKVRERYGLSKAKGDDAPVLDYSKINPKAPKVSDEDAPSINYKDLKEAFPNPPRWKQLNESRTNDKRNELLRTTKGLIKSLRKGQGGWKPHMDD